MTQNWPTLSDAQGKNQQKRRGKFQWPLKKLQGHNMVDNVKADEETKSYQNSKILYLITEITEKGKKTEQEKWVT